MAAYTYKDLAKVLAQVEQGRPAPVYLIAGDPFLCQEFHNQLIQLLLPEEARPFNLEQVDGEKEEIATLLDRLQTFPFFPGRKVVSVKNLLSLSTSEDGERLWKKAVEAWNKGQSDRSTRCLAALLAHSGLPWSEVTGDSRERALDSVKRILPEGKGGEFPGWLREALDTLRSHPLEKPASANPEQLLEEALKRGFPEGHVLVLLAERLPGRKKLVQAISQQGVLVDLSVKQAKKGDQAAALKKYLKERLTKAGIGIHPQAEALLLDRIGPEISIMEMEIQKLLAYLGDRKQIAVNDIQLLVGSSREEPLYELTSALAQRNPIEGLRVLKQLWEQDYNPLQVLAGITTAFRRLLAARELIEGAPDTPAQAWKEFDAFSGKVLPRLKQSPLPDLLAKMHPFVLFNLFKAARGLSPEELSSALESLHRTDRLIKTSSVTVPYLLEDFIFTFCR